VASGFSEAFLYTVDRRDVEMIERGEHMGLAPEPGESVIIVDERVGEDLQRDIAAEVCIRSSVHSAHATFAEEGDDVVVSEPIPDVDRHSLDF